MFNVYNVYKLCLLNVFHHFDWSSQFNICMHAAFLVFLAFFSFLRISNWVPCTLASCQSNNAYFLKRADVSFTVSGSVLRVYRTKTIQFKQHALAIPLPFIPNSVLCPVAQYFRLIFTQYLLARLVRPLLAAQFNRFLKSCVAAVGLNPSNFSSRSFRQGGATFAFNCGALYYVVT